MSTKHELNAKVILIDECAKNLGVLINKILTSDGTKIIFHYNSHSTI
ncbi:hypothetical protein [Fluviispira sanaruensis]|uniref:Uncharacterized protein n=1 Tax=Fluviispira sanaruensis TaxID=2493639 RepID=A0A4P2VSR4_FLUSA|nr:hypothetical protein [Fluviispira sanaruensis]BBH51872.1 hypothetical protein JCM31447_02970 [Fluviispira sanaruensis]